MSLQLLKSDIESYYFRKIYYICGEEPYLKHYYYNELKKAIFNGETEHPDCIALNASELELQEFIDTVSSFSIFSERKAIILKDLSLSDEIENWLLDNIEEIEDNTVIIIYQITESPDARSSDFKLFKKTVSDNGLWVEIGPLDQQTLFKWVSQQFRKQGKTIDSQTLSYFISSTSTDMYSLANEIMKLSSYCDEKITVDAIDKITSKTIDAKTYELTNAVFDKNTEKVFVVNRNLANLTTISFDTLEKMIVICTEADITSKTTSVDYTELLSELIMSIIGLL